MVMYIMGRQQTMHLRAATLLLVLFSSTLSGCTGGGDDEDVMTAFPEFSALADDNRTYTRASMLGQPYFVVFSAEWCDAPCHSTMHAIWGQIPNATVLVFSTDPDPNPQGISLSDWHLKADQFDDERGWGRHHGPRCQPDHLRFHEGPDAAAALGISRPGSVAVVNPVGEIVYLHEGSSMTRAPSTNGLWPWRRERIEALP